MEYSCKDENAFLLNVKYIMLNFEHVVDRESRRSVTGSGKGDKVSTGDCPTVTHRNEIQPTSINPIALNQLLPYASIHGYHPHIQITFPRKRLLNAPSLTAYQQAY